MAVISIHPALEAPRIAQMLAREDMDVVLVNGSYYEASWRTIFACWKARIPVMVRGDSQLASPRGLLRRLCGLFSDQLWRPKIDVEQIMENFIESQGTDTRLEEAAHA